MKLIIVESPTKSKTLKRFLGENYQIAATMGHIRDLPQKTFGIDIDKDFTPNYIIIPKRESTIKELKKLQSKAEQVYLAMDPDREGEAIAWHLSQILKRKNLQRIVFHEITKSAIEKAIENPRKIDIKLVNAQQARRILDRIVGYKLSPFLWKKVLRRLSAGRVQSVTVRLVVEREKEIKNFVPQEYWTIEALLKKDKQEIKALLVKKQGKTIPKLGIKTKKEATKITKDLKGADYKVINVEKKEIKRNPLPPFMTSTLQQEAWKRFRFPAKITMQTAQHLYERGLITYHRSDSLNLSKESLFKTKDFIVGNYGENYWAGFLRNYKTKSKSAQEAHEAIRPTYPDKTPEKVEEKEKLNRNASRLYDLIWRRFIACQMAPAVFDSLKADIEVKEYIFRTTGQTLKFEGFLKVYPLKFEETKLPVLVKDEILELIKLIPFQHFTQAPPRYTEASLIKTLEENGIGRPSTYASIISTIQERNYIQKDEKRRFQPTEIGTVVNNLLVNHFKNIVDINFTAKMEEDLDDIAKGEKKWIPVIKEFYTPFEKNLKEKEKEIPDKKTTYQKTKEKCPKCGAPMVIKLGKYGKFYACSTFPKCKYTKTLKKNKLGIKCPKCKKGEVLEKRTKKRKLFYGCSNWPDCDFASWYKPTGKICPRCSSLLVKTKRNQVKCSNKECDYKNLPSAEP
ncbi:MAG: type I DNA topoisomerase [Candidatus Nealsonbacteria bacterium]